MSTAQLQSSLHPSTKCKQNIDNLIERNPPTFLMCTSCMPFIGLHFPAVFGMTCMQPFLLSNWHILYKLLVTFKETHDIYNIMWCYFTTLYIPLLSLCEIVFSFFLIAVSAYSWLTKEGDRRRNTQRSCFQEWLLWPWIVKVHLMGKWCMYCFLRTREVHNSHEFSVQLHSS